MGLDMYLYKETYIGGKYANKNDIITINNGYKDIKIKIKDIHSIKTEILYWRKNYAIDEWMSNRIKDGEDDNCRYFDISYKTLKKLRNILKKIISAITKEEKIKIAQKEFNTNDLKEYFDEYLKDFERTYKELKKIINNPKFKSYNYYYYISY